MYQFPHMVLEGCWRFLTKIIKKGSFFVSYLILIFLQQLSAEFQLLLCLVRTSTDTVACGERQGERRIRYQELSRNSFRGWACSSTWAGWTANAQTPMPTMQTRFHCHGACHLLFLTLLWAAGTRWGLSSRGYSPAKSSMPYHWLEMSGYFQNMQNVSSRKQPSPDRT